MLFRVTIVLFFTGIIFSSQAQNGGVKGTIRDKKSGADIEGALVQIRGTDLNTLSNPEGYYIITDVKPGNVQVIISITGYKSDTFAVQVQPDKVALLNIFLEQSVFTFSGSRVTDTRKKKKNEDIDVGTTKIRPAQLSKIPTIGGTPDLVQYLQILPGVVFSGDQGGQLYIRGGSPVMNKIILDGMTIYNPFHSIGLFSVFDVDLMKSADVYSAGFGAEYGGRISAIVDVKTRDGNRNRIAGNAAISPFLGKFSLEGPMKKFVQTVTAELGCGFQLFD